MWRTPATLAGRLDDVPNGAAAPRDPRAGDELRRHLRRRRHAGGEIRSNVISSQGVHDRYGGVVPEVASRHHLELMGAVVEDALAQAEATLAELDAVAVTQGPGLVGALLVGVATAKALAAAHGLPLIPVDHLHGHVAASFLAAEPVRAAVPDPDRQRRAHAARARARTTVRTGRCWADARRRGGRGVRQGRADAGARLPGRAGAAAARADGDPEAFAFPTARQARASTSPSPASRRRCSTRCESWVRRSPRAPRRSRRLLPARDRGDARAARRAALEQTGVGRLALGGGVAANGPLRERMRALGADVDIPPIELCTDNAAMIASAARYLPALPFPDYLALDAYATASATCDGEVVLYGRPGCHLCDDARAVLERMRAELPFALVERDIERTTRCTGPTWSAFRSSRSTARSCSTSSSTRRSCDAA